MRTYNYISKQMLLDNGYSVIIKDDGTPIVKGPKGIKSYIKLKGPSKYSTNVKPYLYIGLTIDKQPQVMYSLARIVWAWYHEECPIDITIDHINDKHDTPYDNRIDNLQVLTLENNLKKKKISRNQFNWFLSDEEILANRAKCKYIYLNKEQIREKRESKAQLNLQLKPLYDNVNQLRLQISQEIDQTKKRALRKQRKAIENQILELRNEFKNKLKEIMYVCKTTKESINNR